MGIDFTIRKMRDSDLPAVAEVEAGVFTDWYRVHRRDNEPLPERTLEELRYATSIEPDGNLVAVSAEGALVGFILARTWGSVGWFGTFGVPTQFQGMGIGKALVACTVRHLRAKASIIGLETMPESGANIGLYAKSGFVLCYPTVLMELPLDGGEAGQGGASGGNVVTWSSLSQDARLRRADQIREIADAILRGLDYTREVEAMAVHGFGETFLSMDGDELVGVAVLRTAPFRTVDMRRKGYVHLLALRPGCDRDPTFESLLQHVRAHAAAARIKGLVAGVSARYPEAVDLLYSNGFRSQRVATRMVARWSRADIFQRSPEINLSRWVG